MHNLSETDINFIISNEVVIENKKKLQTSNMVYFNLDLPDSVKSYIKYKLGLDLFGKKDIPMRWIKGDTPSHIDSNPTHNHFENTESDKTYLTWEYPTEYKPEETEPMYPVNDLENNTKYLRYKELADQEKNVIFGGRLAEYKYYDMHQVIDSALNFVDKINSK